MILNQLKTVILLAILSGLFVAFGYLFGGYTGLHVALIMALLMNAITYFFSDKIVLYMYGAQPLDPERYKRVYEIVGELAETMQLPMPKLWLIETPMANAFATGRNPSHASVAITTGILSILDEQELRGVLSHELAHVKNRDILIATIAATIATAISYLAHMAQHLAWIGSLSNDRRRNTNPIVMILVAIVMPIAAMLIQLAISRSREYLADETGATYSRDPLALASALEKLHDHATHAHLHSTESGKASTASLFIVNPFSAKGLIALFSTHPPMEERVARLRHMFETMY